MEQRDFDLVDTAIMHSGYPLAIGAWGRIRKEYAEAHPQADNTQSTAIAKISAQWDEDAKLLRKLGQFQKAEGVEQCAQMLRTL